MRQLFSEGGRLRQHLRKQRSLIYLRKLLKDDDLRHLPSVTQEDKAHELFGIC